MPKFPPPPEPQRKKVRGALLWDNRPSMTKEVNETPPLWHVYLQILLVILALGVAFVC